MDAHGLETRRGDDQSIPDKRRRTVNDVDGAVVFIARTMPCHRTRASFSDLSKIQIQQTNVFESSEIKIKIQLKPIYFKAATENHFKMSTPPCLE